MRKQVILRLDEGLFARVEAARGDVPRQRWLVRAVESYLGLEPDRVSDVTQEMYESPALEAQFREPAKAWSKPKVTTAHASGHSPADPDATRLRDPAKVPGVVRASSLTTCPECGSTGRVHQRGCKRG